MNELEDGDIEFDLWVYGVRFTLQVHHDVPYSRLVGWFLNGKMDKTFMMPTGCYTNMFSAVVREIKDYAVLLSVFRSWHCTLADLFIKYTIRFTDKISVIEPTFMKARLSFGETRPIFVLFEMLFDSNGNNNYYQLLALDGTDIYRRAIRQLDMPIIVNEVNQQLLFRERRAAI